MPVDILLWIETISKIDSTLSSVLDTINKLRHKYLVNGKDLDKLKKDVEDLSEKIGYTKKIGEVLKEYIEYYNGSYLLFTSSDKLHEMINSYYTDLSDDSSENYTIYWSMIDMAFGEVKKNKSNYINVMLGRIKYFDNKDAFQINIYVDEINSDYTKAQTYLRVKNTEEFKNCIDDMSTKSLKLYEIFKNSIGNMTNGLMRI